MKATKPNRRVASVPKPFSRHGRGLGVLVGVLVLVGWALVIACLGVWGYQTGLYDTKWRFWLFAISNFTVLLGLIWWNGRVLMWRDAERKRAEEALRTSHEQTEQILSSITSILIGVDASGRITRWNAAAQATFGIGPADVLNRLLAECDIHWDPTSVLDGLAECKAKTRPVRLNDIRVTRPDGMDVIVGITITPVRGEEGTLSGFLLLGADITERRRAEEALRRSQQELLAANKRLGELATIKDELIAKVSHELRTPLTAIKEGVSLVLDGALGSVSDEQKDFLSTVDENIDRLAELINHLLDLSKIEAGRLRLLRKRLSIPQLIETTLESYKAIAAQRTLAVELVPVPSVFADTNRILQVLGNLFSNAVKFTAQDGKITFAVQEQDGFVTVSVRDNGVGIAKDDVPKLFEKFSQVGEDNGRPRGTGLGLALCKELVELHEGAISVSSEAGSGSTFTFTLPVYTSRFALEASFKELVGFAKLSQQETVGLIVFDSEPLLRYASEQGVCAVASPGAAGPSGSLIERLEQLAELVRKSVHHGDVVLSIEPRWVVVLALADLSGMQAIVQRLRKALQEWTTKLGASAVSASLRFGTAIYPTDGRDAPSLFARAINCAEQQL